MMKRSGVMLLFASIVLTWLAVRYDLEAWRSGTGYALFQRGDLDGAIAAWSSSGTSLSSAYNRGVAQLGKGETDKAIMEFKKASETDDAPLRQRSLYNLGTIMLNNGINAAAKDRDRALQTLEAAASTLHEAVRLGPDDPDARHNEALARTTLAELGTATRKKAQPPPEQPPAQTAGTRPDRMKNDAQTSKQGRPGNPVDQGNGNGRTRSAPTMTEADVNRLLHEARGREALRSTKAAGSGPAENTPPEKDW